MFSFMGESQLGKLGKLDKINYMCIWKTPIVMNTNTHTFSVGYTNVE